MPRRNTDKMRNVIARLQNHESLEPSMVVELLRVSTDAIDILENEKEYLENSLTAAVQGTLPERFDLNQLLLAQRAKSYLDWLAKTVDPRDKLRPAGSNETVVKI